MMQRNEATGIRGRVFALSALTILAVLQIVRINPLGVAIAYLALLGSVEAIGLIAGVWGGLVASVASISVLVFVNQYVGISLRESALLNVAAELAGYTLAGPLAGWVAGAIAKVQQRADYWLTRAEEQTVHNETLGALKPTWAQVRLDEELLRAARFGRPLSVVLTRLEPNSEAAVSDRTQRVAVMRAAIRIAQATTQPPAVVAHAGGERIMLILPEYTADQAQQTVKLLQKRWAQEPYYPEGQGQGLGRPLCQWGTLRAEVGIPSSPAETATALLARLDGAQQ